MCNLRTEHIFFATARNITEKLNIERVILMIKIELTEEEAEVVDNYLFKKVCRLEDANLRESFCYPRLYSAHRKLSNALKESKETK